MTGPFTAWAVEALIASAVLMAIVLLARAPARRVFGPQVAYALWALPALRLLLPPLPADVTEQATMPISRATELVLVAPADLPAAADPAAAVPWLAIGLAAWALGAAAFFAVHLLRHRRFCRRLLADARVLDDVGGVRVIESDAASGPLAFGTLHRFVAFPCDFAERYDADERELALLHELGHHGARDLWANWAALAVLALHWFNPLAWRAFRAFRCDQELANDARVLANRGRADRHIYACAILKAAHGGHVSAACHLHTIADLKGRLRMLTRTRPSRRRLAAGATAVAGVVAAGLALTASGTRAAAAVTERIGDAVGVDIAQAAPPAPAAVPAAPASPEPAATPRAVKRVVVRRNGETRVMEGAEADAFVAANPPPAVPLPPQRPDLKTMPGATLSADGKSWKVWTDGTDGPRFTMVTPPDITSRACVDGPDGGPRQFVLQREGKDRHVTIICRNRIDAAAREGARRGQELAQNAEFRADIARRQARNGRVTAFASIRTARASIAADRNLTDDQRREALAGLADAEAELRSSND